MNKKVCTFIIFLSFFYRGFEAQVGRGAQIQKSKSFEIKKPASFSSQGTIGKKTTFESIKQWFASKRPMSTSKAEFKPVSSKTPLMSSPLKNRVSAFKQPDFRRSFFTIFSRNTIVDLNLPVDFTSFALVMSEFSLISQFRIREMIGFVKKDYKQSLGVYSNYKDDSLWKSFENKYRTIKYNENRNQIINFHNPQRFFNVLNVMGEQEKKFLNEHARISTSYRDGYSTVSNEFASKLLQSRAIKSRDDLSNMTKAQPDIPWVYTINEYEEAFKPLTHKGPRLEIRVSIPRTLVNNAVWRTLRLSVNNDDAPSRYSVVNDFISFLVNTGDTKKREQRFYKLMKEYSPESIKGDKEKEALVKELGEAYDRYNID